MTIATGEAPIKRYRMKLDGQKMPNVVELRAIPVDAIKRDPAYQRDLNMNWIKLHRPFIPDQAGTITVSLRAGSLWVVDGGHRVELAHLDEVPQIKAFVIDGMTLQQEASLFVRLQRERRALSAWDLYKAELAGQEAPTMEMEAAVVKAGFRIAPRTNGDPRVITAIDSLRFVHRLGGPTLLTDTLRLVTDSMWLNLDRALSGPILKGIAIFLHSEVQRPAYDAEHTVKVLRKQAPVFVLMKAQQIAIERRSASVSATNVAQAILDAYNDRLSPANKLPAITINNRKRPAPKGAGKSAA